ncbi:hypothetical protein IWX46DRAFT_428460 [Phyllosticta citricarpa]|uniref:Uncharacterized protein n=1 Tax=Phyllosticta citricarpa TaxID=55181 RepID=A0ABR1MML2_9PEZI
MISSRLRLACSLPPLLSFDSSIFTSSLTPSSRLFRRAFSSSITRTYTASHPISPPYHPLPRTPSAPRLFRFSAAASSRGGCVYRFDPYFPPPPSTPSSSFLENRRVYCSPSLLHTLF